MTLSPQLLQFGGSLVAIVFVAWLVRRMGMGGPTPLSTDADIRDAAAEVVDGFQAKLVAGDESGKAALAKDAQGRLMLLKSHGAHVAGRILTAVSRAEQLSENAIRVDCGESRFGKVDLEIQDASTWVAAINSLN